MSLSDRRGERRRKENLKQQNFNPFISGLELYSFWLKPHFLKGFPGGSNGQESACNAGDLGSIPGLGRSPGEGKGYPLQHSDLENSMDCIVHGVAKSWI